MVNAAGGGSNIRLNKRPELATQQSQNNRSFFSQFSTFTEVATGSMQERVLGNTNSLM